MGYQSERDIKATVCDHMILNNPITVGDIKSTHKFFGSDVTSLKGKTVRRKTSHVRMQYVAIPRQVYGLNRMVIFMAGPFIDNGLVSLLTIPQKKHYSRLSTSKRELPKFWTRPQKCCTNVYLKEMCGYYGYVGKEI